MTFEVKDVVLTGQKYGWQQRFEAYSICRACRRATLFAVVQSDIGFQKIIESGGLLMDKVTINRYVEVESHVSLKDEAGVPPPEHLPSEIEAVFKEGATCLAVGCNNAAGTMFRLCLDLATRSKLPKEDVDGLNKNIRRSLGLRLPWLFDHNLLPPTLRDLSSCVKEDGNDGAHAGTLTKEDAEDLLDFTTALLERLYTEPKQLTLAAERRAERRTPR